jgi:hypothetical protein
MEKSSSMRRSAFLLCLSVVWLKTTPSRAADAGSPQPSAVATNASVSPGHAANVDSLRRVSLSLDAGTTGTGGAVWWRMVDHFGVHGGVDYFPYAYDGVIKGIPYDSHLQMLSETVTADYFPWQKHSFYISAGAVFNQLRLSGQSQPTSGTITIGNTTYPANDIGIANLLIRQQPVAPYLGIGGNLLTFDKEKHWAIGAELGAYYAGDAKVDFSTTSGLVSASDIAAEKSKIKEYADDARIWPVAKLSLKYAF